MNRLALAETLAADHGATVERFIFPSKIPVPSVGDAAATIAIIQDIARHHEAHVQSVSPDYRWFYLAHRAARLTAVDGSWLCSIVHDNTLAGGERVAELVTRPLLRADLPWLESVVARLAAIDGCVVPESGALHVHLDGRAFCSAEVLARLVRTWLARETELRELAGTTAAMRRAGPLPEALAPALEALARCGATWDQARAELARHVTSRSFGLNLYNLVENDPQKLTVELKIARGSLDPARVIAIRELAVALAQFVLEGG